MSGERAVDVSFGMFDGGVGYAEYMAARSWFMAAMPDLAVRWRDGLGFYLDLHAEALARLASGNCAGV